MDKLKRFLVVLKKYQFWAICGAVMVTALTCWWLATIGLAGQFRQRKSKLEGDFKGVIIQRNHPNQDVVDRINQQHEALRRGVYEAWQDLYSEQKKKNPFPKVLGEDFKRQFENLKPKEELRPQYRELYQNFIMGHFPRLLEMIDVRRPAEQTEGRAAGAERRGAGGMGAERRPARAAAIEPGRMGARTTPGMAGADGGANDELWIGTVEWNDNDYRLLEQRFEWKETPSTLAVVLAQEDLWVYEALLRVIKDTNEGYPTAAVKRIEALEVGRDAARAWKDAEEAVFRAGAAAVESPTVKTMEMPGMTSTAVATVSAEDQARQQLIENRYVDDKGKPLPYDAEYPYAKHPYAEFKMMPIRMNLVMDQRRLPKLLVECANSNMPIEVRRIRILKSQGSSIDLASATAAAPAQGGAHRAPEGMMRPRSPVAAPMARPAADGGRMRPAAEGGRMRPAADSQTVAPNDIPVEIHGVIYIYNPPDREKLGTGTASGEKPAEAIAETPIAAGEVAAKPAAKPATPKK